MQSYYKNMEFCKNIGSAFITAVDAERAYHAALLALAMLPVGGRKKIAALISLESVALIGSATFNVAASQSTEPAMMSEFSHVGSGATGFGPGSYRIGLEFRPFWTTATKSRSPALLNRAAEQFAQAVAVVGANALVGLLARRSGKMQCRDRVVSRWVNVAANINFGRVDNGLLWSRLGKNGESVAAGLARKNSLTTLEIKLAEFGIRQPLDRDLYGLSGDSVLTVWEGLSRRFAQALAGDAIAYIDDGNFRAAVMSKPLTQSDIQRDAASFKDHRNLPLLTAELETIADIMLTNSALRTVSVRDIRDKLLYIMTQDMVRKTAKMSM